jgi:ABC-type multidrug transport system ATPase subunit
LNLRVELQGASKLYGETQALHPLSRTLFPGMRLAVLGHNGAGKSTLLSLLSTLASPSTGKLRFFADSVELNGKGTIRSRISLLGHKCMLYPDLTLWENLRFFARLYGVQEEKPRLEGLLERLGLYRERHRLLRTCSQGMTQRLAIARALVHDPQLLLLDEPFSGLDLHGVERASQLLSGFPGLLVMVTHEPRHAWALCEHFLILRRGRLVAESSRGQGQLADLENLLRNHLPGEM